jgi:hypothetical protein
VGFVVVVVVVLVQLDKDLRALRSLRCSDENENHDNLPEESMVLEYLALNEIEKIIATYIGCSMTTGIYLCFI